MIDNYQPYEFDFESMDYTGLAEEADARAEDSADSISEDAASNLAGYYDAESLLQPDPFQAAQEPGITPEQKAEMQAALIARNDLLEMTGLALTGDGIIAENSKVAAKTMQSLAQRDVTIAQTSNEHLKVLQAIEQGMLITEKTKGIALQGVTQQVLNGREFQTIQLEMGKTEALVSAKVQEINSIYATAKAKSLKAYQESMKTIGADVTGYLGSSGPSI